MTALDSMGTGLLSMVLRLLSSLCQDTDGRGSPDAWHSRLMGSPTLTRTGPAGVTVATGDSVVVTNTDVTLSNWPLEGHLHLQVCGCMTPEM